jgi:hypothetical protein
MGEGRVRQQREVRGLRVMIDTIEKPREGMKPIEKYSPGSRSVAIRADARWSGSGVGSGVGVSGRSPAEPTTSWIFAACSGP